MKTRRLISLLLALVLAATCFAGCRKEKEEPAPEEPAAAETPAVVEPEKEEPQQIEVIDTVPEVPGGLEENGELIIDVPEDSELGGD